MNTIDEYLEHVTPTQKIELERIRRIVKNTVPEAEEVISYGMPTFKLNGKQIINFAAFKNHMSIFGNIEELANKLDGFKMSHKGTLQFTEDKPVPEEIIVELIKNRVKHDSEDYEISEA